MPQALEDVLKLSVFIALGGSGVIALVMAARMRRWDWVLGIVLGGPVGGPIWFLIGPLEWAPMRLDWKPGEPDPRVLARSRRRLRWVYAACAALAVVTIANEVY
jgi:hypothetical protein